MFRKLISQLAFSPTLITEVGFYAKRLKQEEVTRRLTLLFLALALVMQSLAVFSAPESANASSEQDIIRGGVRDMGDFLLRYDHNEDDVKDIYTALGINRSEIAAAEPTSIHIDSDIYVLSRYGQAGNSEKEVSVAYQRSTGGTGVRYFSPVTTPSGSTYLRGWTGHSATLGWFGIIQSSGALATDGLPTSVSPADATTIGATKSIAVAAISPPTPERDTEPLSVAPSDKISYTLKATNPHATSITTTFTVRIADILEYAKLIDSGGGSYDETTGTLQWPSSQLVAGASQTRTFAVQVLSSIPATAIGSSNLQSYNCALDISFGNSLATPVQCSGAKNVESLLRLLPPTPLHFNIAFAVIVFFVVGFFYIRVRQLKHEIRLVRHNFNSGTL